MKKIAIAALLIALVVLFVALGGRDYLTLEGIRSSLATLEAWRDDSFVGLAILFFFVYVVATALSLPGAAVLTLAGGALFGLLWGLVIVSFASSIGATAAFFVSRYLLHDWVQAKFGARLRAINKGIERDGAFYLLSLRLVPAVPFFIINLVMGLTPIRGWTFYWVSQVGMLAGTFVYVNAGTQLAQVSSLGEIASFELLASFTLLGIFPLIAKFVLARLQAMRVYKKWPRPKKFDRNLVVIGAGAAGLVSALIAATVRAKVTLVESHKMGGDCLNYGCVPSKALIKSARVAETMRRAKSYGLQAQTPQLSFRKIFERVQAVVKAIEPHDSVERYRGMGVDVQLGHAQLVDPWTVAITDHEGQQQILTTRSIIIAAGAEPLLPPIPGLVEAGVLTSDSLWQTFAERDEMPERLLVLGGGPIGCELAQAFARLGVAVTQVEMAERLLLKEDADVATLVATHLKESGVKVLTGHKAIAVESDEAGGQRQKFLVAEAAGERVRLGFDEIICALGRAPRLTGYGLEALGIATQQTVTTNEYLQTLYPNIYAAGDVAGPYQFTHTAAHQAWYASVNALFGQFKKFKADYRVIPWVTYTDPEVARVGLNEQEAEAQGVAFEVSRYGIDDLDRAITESDNYGFIKVLTPPGRDKILGVTIVGPHAGELIAEFILAMRWGLGLNKILATIHPYPTWNEANKYAAGEWKKARAPKKLLRWVARYHQWRRG
ncbi:FAD-dependent oxidoreductase [Halioxenophilus sp. WMMB6]|uniref:FAD-dependent oxidoreductase n=1 Tax=Halioxenophilus sp. WMMB6 TaxID=3073815 RepID=UPI00295EFE31|nr:FAD-dependent oxidoreductase [Halioxenophilus sp. WMMB6]